MPEENIAVTPIESAAGREEAPAIVDEAKSPDDVSSGRGEAEQAPEQADAQIPEDEKSLKSLYTKATQKLSEYEKQAEAWEQLRQDPDFAKFIETKTKAQPQQAQEPQALQPLTQEQIDSMTPDQIMRHVVEMAKQELRSEYDPVIQRVSQREETANREAAQATIKEFFGKFPQAEKFRGELAAIIKVQQVPLDKAWEQLSNKLKDYSDTSKQEVYKEMDVKRDANLLMPGDTTKVTPATKEKMSAKDAVLKAMGEAGY
jgi:hypothetical protein